MGKFERILEPSFLSFFESISENYFGRKKKIENRYLSAQLATISPVFSWFFDDS